MTDREVEAMHAKPVLVTTHDDLPVSMGRIRVRHELKGQGLRVEIQFETEVLACTIGVPAERVAQLHASFRGEEFRYALPPGDKLWFGDNPPPGPTTDAPAVTKPGSDATPPAGLVETFPLPPKSRLIGPATEQHSHPRPPDDFRRPKR